MRDPKNYPGLYFSVALLDGAELTGVSDLFAMPVSIELDGGLFALKFKVWESGAAFSENHPSLEKLDKRLEFRVRGKDLLTFQSENAEIYALILETARGFLQDDLPEKYAIDRIEIDLLALTVLCAATYTGREQFIRRTVSSPEEFELVKSEYATFVGALSMFAWQFGKENSSLLSEFS